ncbi:helix-turn-helix transcriptional regulator [Sphingomonas sp. ABOLG]|jgi:DNA-binding transcriptional ArsR family regulator|uniref:ArsR/SmtB family transcription factor n=1 Tax=Sphingomonas sp. ABOLG TaxID=1985880 RepID=UPI0019D06669|nr:metalloregulator ArsR/SmtB family transcription factor [Sphingomonas sp. ABOLG]
MHALTIMSALAQASRFSAFVALVEALPGGMASSDIAAAIGTTPNTMSAHLAILERAGLVSSEKIGRSVIYRAETDPVEGLSDFLAHACQRGRKARVS